MSIPELRLDPPEEKITGYCDFCGSEIYAGELCYAIEDKQIHVECLEGFAKESYAKCLKEAGADV